MLKIKFPTVAYDPTQPYSEKPIKYVDMRRPLAHCISCYEWLTIYQTQIGPDEEDLVQQIPTTELTLFEPNLPDGWAEALEVPNFQTAFIYYVYMNWFNPDITPLLNPFNFHQEYFSPETDTQCKKRYQRLVRYIRTNPDTTRDIQKFIQDMFDRGWEENQLFYEEVLAYWDSHKAQTTKRQPLIIPDNNNPNGGRQLPAPLVRKRFRYLRDAEPEWYQDIITTNPDLDPEDYNSRCEILLLWEQEKARRQEEKQSKKERHKDEDQNTGQ